MGLSTRLLVRVLNQGAKTIPAKASFRAPLPISRPFSTALHQVARFGTPEEVQQQLRLLGTKAAAVAAQTISDDKGELAIEVGRRNPWNQKRYLSIDKALLPHTSPTLSALSQKIDVPHLLEQYKQGGEDLQKILKLAALAVNQARDIIKASSTHPSSNLLRPSELEEQNKKTQQIRNGYKFINKPLTYHKAIVADTKKTQFGNCTEFAHLVAQLLMDKKIKFPVDIFSIEKGDHVFVVLNRKPGSDPTNPATWGKNAVAVDAWGKFVCPAAELTKHLKSHRSYNYFEDMPFLNLAVYFNPKFHGLKLNYRFEPVLKGDDVTYTIKEIKEENNALQNGDESSDDEGLAEITRLLRK